MSDEQFHEFQLDGKQLVFLFMAGTVVAVVIFLFGVMVGRGVRSPQTEPPEFAAAVDPAAAPAHAADALSPEEAPAPTLDELVYSESLPNGGPLPETLREPAAPPRDEPAPPPPPKAVETPRPSVASTTSALPKTVASKNGSPAAASAATASANTTARSKPTRYAVQVTSVANRSQAKDTEADLDAKGYPAYVEPTPDGQFRVRIGPYNDRKQADQVRARLEKEGKFKKLWVPPIP